jgi:hypothetical protein
MLPLMVSGSIMLVTIGLILLTNSKFASANQPLIYAVIIIGLVLLPACILLIRIEEKRKRIQDQALLIHLMAIASKMGVGLEEFKRSKDLLKLIFEINTGWFKKHGNKRDDSKNGKV